MKKNNICRKCKALFEKMQWTRAWRRCVIILCVLVVVALVIYNVTGDRTQGENTFIGVVLQWGEVWVGLISALLIVWQLSREASVEEDQFITEYNRSFIENEHMVDIECYLECQMSGANPEELLLFTKERQNLVNYLVYLEGFSSCLLKKRIRFSDVDDLFAYRFFLALNHPEVQSIDLLPCAGYYRGCYQLYDKWMDFRETCGKYTEEDNWEVPLYSSALHNYQGYEKYAFPKFSVDKKTGMITVHLNGWKKILQYSTHTIEKNQLCAKIESFSKKGLTGRRTCTKMLRAALKELLYSEHVEKIECSSEEIKTIWDQLVEARKILCRDGVHFRQLHKKLKISDDNLKRIARLIYDTDPYISPDLFGSRDNAVAALPKLLRSGKDPMFHLDNLFVCELRDEIVGIVLWHREPLNWTADHLIDALKKSKCKFDEDKIRNVQNEYVAGYANTPESLDISLLNVCVSEHVRGFGIGEKMLRAYLEQHAEDTHKLCVLEENKGAIKLYKALGFCDEGPDEAYPPGSGRKRLNMRKDPNEQQAGGNV